ncbi:TetR/AcrR family transcriptional regulator [Virgibacillus sp. CBA3643]|uniref:TetR/AcrR family transcriptional regulator n=1 Tax=Virgibacillus sp. CBA3643 TaxID=2942278 RepID=UPI0035A33136
MARERKFTKKKLYQTTKEALLEYSYAGFTFRIVAERLHIARGTLYKYYENKDELITDYMVEEMNHFLNELHKINTYKNFEDQFDYLLYIIFKDREIHQIREMTYQIPTEINEKVKANKVQLDKQHQTMYATLQHFVQLGKTENLLNPTLPDSLILGFIFQTIDIPNHASIPYSQWVSSIKTMLTHGIFTN